MKNRFPANIHENDARRQIFDLRGLSLKKYYGKPIEDRDPIFVALFFYCNILNEKNNSEHENIRNYGSAGRVNFTPPWYIV